MVVQGVERIGGGRTKGKQLWFGVSTDHATRRMNLNKISQGLGRSALGNTTYH